MLGVPVFRCQARQKGTIRSPPPKRRIHAQTPPKPANPPRTPAPPSPATPRARDHAHLCRRPRRAARQGRQEPGHRRRPCRRADHRGRPADAHAGHARGRGGGDGGPAGCPTSTRGRFGWSIRSDGTKEFIKRNGRVHGEYRADRGRPADARHRAGTHHRHAVARRGPPSAPKKSEAGWRLSRPIRTAHAAAGGPDRARPAAGTAIYSDLDIWFGREGPHHRRSASRAGSSLKFCLIADGQGGHLPRAFGPDLRMGHRGRSGGVLEAAGRRSRHRRRQAPSSTAKPEFHNPHFIARSKAARS